MTIDANTIGWRNALEKTFCSQPEFAQNIQNVHTPFDLCNEMVAKLWQSFRPNYGSKILTFNLEFVEVLIHEYKVRKETIWFLTDCPQKAKILNYPHYKGVNVIVADYLTWENNNMKFDAIVGNPPYQDGEKGYKGLATLWPKFVKKSFGLVNRNGYILMVTPPSWMSPGSELFEVLKPNLLHIDLDCGKYFSVGSEFSWWLYSARPASKCMMVSKNETTISSIENLPFLPNILNEKSISIIRKVLVANLVRLPMNINSECHSQKTDIVCERKEGEFQYPVYHTNTITLYSVVPHTNFKKKKVIISLTGNFNPVYDDGNIGTGQNVFWIEVKSEKDGLDLIDYLTKSKLMRFIMTVCKWSGANTRGVLRLLPHIDLSKSCKDADLYTHFNLLPEEIALIEETIK